MNVLSLFDGISCGQIALNKCGIKYDKYFASEIEPKAIKVAQHNYPETIQIGNVLEVKAKDLPKIDLLIGGSPCQGFSSIGKGLSFEDERSKLFFEYVRILNEVKAINKDVTFLLENVKMKKEWQDAITKIMGVEPIFIDSAVLSGAMRKRLYWTNIKGIKQPTDLNIQLKDILEADAAFGYVRNKDKNGIVIERQVNKATCIDAHYFTGQDYRGQRTWVKTLDGKRRKFTVSECCRLQGVPDGYLTGISKNASYQVLGNGWNVDTICHLFKPLQ